ncbi:MAG: 6-O-methylguanine DNA methyltransferase [Candidatus Yonathbacteria bacterium CG_4_10_14_3_um_filter_47_65]|uniref:6-O-methylguanine DNA methyltransferase n=2 Tax=Parcubacteria group TaxID=1794811 RepID=A0A2M8D669_9BACT|nr:MAG: hypothetical protein AUJ44_01685 [Candidatus Nomurabacteria bacterium CG1_02_47_685]PIP03586.1 MAG: 6-O-methylguanine DNA methyltransferase [Candidatus Yonathbacteria bacterium CG23_combo_of_CG06-09_8_20_14_all_46_18]PIQ31407.1 MAG: 6-O-methylguanine DNA methyltransferase [Candidatus Yonathbacteria bacterium CG17_big_fil_post_rev_8_21_14_2_50_46_19]PIX56364.1 MAG: 6-O-methylguanine DNA methyltransferase [Candidatus Yonathbacteria bacterium CG_4_10_14_3_um_filter_47_65]PIY57512.1 MAG: 6-
MKNNFTENVLSVIACIPKGEILTYREITKQIANQKVYYVVGNILNKNHNSAIRCHRVVRSDGTPGGYSR